MNGTLIVRAGELWLRRGRAERRLLPGPNIVAIARSRDARQVAVVSRIGSTSGLRVIDVNDGSSFIALETERVLTSPAWCPDGTQLTIVVNDDDGRADLRRIVVDGAAAGPETIEVVGGRYSLAEPDWSGDGRWLAIEGQPLDELRGMTIFLQDRVAGTTLLLDPLDAPEPKSACPRFAPHGSRLCYTYTAVGVMESEIRLFDPETGTRSTLAIGGLNDPRWSSDGSSLLAASHDSVCESHLVRVEVESGEITVITNPSGQHTSPIHLNRSTALYIARSCSGVDEVPTDSGVLWSIELRSGVATEIARETSLALAM